MEPCQCEHGYVQVFQQKSFHSRGLLYLTVFVSMHIELVFGLSAQGVLEGKYDDLPEQAFYMVGGVEEVAQKAEKMAKDMQ